MNIEDIADIFRAQGLEFRADAEHLTSGFENCALVFGGSEEEEADLVFEAVWRGIVPPEMAPHLLYAVNEHNQTHFAPTLRMLESEEGPLAASATRTLDISAGVTREQLEAFVLSSIGMALECFAALERSFPTLVDWKDPHDDHA